MKYSNDQSGEIRSSRAHSTSRTSVPNCDQKLLPSVESEMELTQLSRNADNPSRDFSLRPI